MVTVEIPLTGDFRGKNGWAGAKRAHVEGRDTYAHCYAPTCYAPARCPHSISFEVFSRAAWVEVAPVIVDLSPEEARALAAALLTAADA